MLLKPYSIGISKTRTEGYLVVDWLFATDGTCVLAKFAATTVNDAATMDIATKTVIRGVDLLRLVPSDNNDPHCRHLIAAGLIRPLHTGHSIVSAKAILASI